MVKKLINAVVFSLALAIALAFVAFLGANTGFFLLQQKDTKEVNVGAILALSGPAAYWGDYAKKGFSLALEEINNGSWFKHGKISLLVEDGKALPRESVTAYSKLENSNKIAAVITNFSSVGMAISPLANKGKIIQMDFSSTTPDYSSKGDFTFRTTASGTFENSKAAEIARGKLKARTVGVIFINNAFGVSAKNVFSKKFSGLGGTIVGTEAFEQNSTDLRTQLLKISEKNPDVIYFITHTLEAPILVRQAKELGIKSRLFGTQWMINREFFEALGSKADGIVFVSTFDEKNPGSEFKKYWEMFLEKFGEEPSLADAQAFDALMLIATAMNQCGNAYDSECVRDSLFKIKDYAGASGTISFDENGDTTKPTILKIIKDSKAVDFEG